MKSTDVALVKAGLEDADTFLLIEKKVENSTYHAVQNETEMSEMLKKGQVYFIKAGGRVVGTVSYECLKDGGVYLDGLAISPEYQGLGYARIALSRVLTEIRDAPYVELLTHPNNLRAVSLYESFGFTVIGRKENPFGDGEPRLILRKTQQ